MTLELFVLSWGVYPRRILIYLSEKNLLSSPALKITEAHFTDNGMSALGKPPGTVPILSLGDGKYIKQSLAILEYFEDICDAAQRDNTTVLGMKPSRPMRGDTAEERARTREMIAIVDEAVTHWGVAVHKGSALFSGRETQSAVASAMSLQFCRNRLELSAEDEKVNLADVVLVAFVQFAKNFYGKDVLVDLPNLKRIYEGFEKRESAKIEESAYPAFVTAMAQTWIERAGELKFNTMG